MTKSSDTARALAGIGVGLRLEFASALVADADAPIAFVEVHPENFVCRGGAHATMLAVARARFPIITHGLTFGFANEEAPTRSSLADLRRFVDLVGSPLHSDHLCFTSTEGRFTHELLPPAFDDRTVEVAAIRMHAMREALGRPVAVENVSYYVPRSGDPLDEIEVLREILERADGRLLLDINNVVVNAHNHGFDPRAWLARAPLERVAQIHVAGHFVRDDGLRIDTHGTSTSDEVRDLLGEVLERIGPVPVLLERDTEMPSYDELRSELVELRSIYDGAMERRRRAPRPERTFDLASSRVPVHASNPRAGEPLDAGTLQRTAVNLVLGADPDALGADLVAVRWNLCRRMARARLHDLLRSVHARTRARLTAAAFDPLFDAWLDARGPRTRVFWKIAEEFSDFALARPELREPLARDLLRLERAEWHVRQAPYPIAPLVAPLVLDGRAVIAPAFETLNVEHDVQEVELPVTEIARAADRFLVIFRLPDDGTCVLSLNPLARAIFTALVEPHSSITSALQSVARARNLSTTPNVLESIADTLAQWHSLGLLLGTRAERDT